MTPGEILCFVSLVKTGISRQHRDAKAFFASGNKRAIAKFVVLEQNFESLSEATVI